MIVTGLRFPEISVRNFSFLFDEDLDNLWLNKKDISVNLSLN